MAEPTRKEINEQAVALGLTNAAKYPNKEAVTDAIARVSGGEDALVVDKELTPVEEPKAPTTPAATSDETEEGEEKPITALNGGMPTKFDKTGNPVYSREEI